MAKALVFRFGKADLSFQLEKVDRKKLYGYVDSEVLDGKGRGCQLAILGGDGKTLVGRGGSALLMLAPDGSYCERAQLKPVSPEGQPLTKVPTSFAAPIPLDRRTTVDEYLGHSVKAVYALTPPMGAEDLLKDLKGGAIYSFPFSYNGGLDPDVGFLLAGADGTAFLALGKPARLDFVTLRESADPDEPTALEEDEADEDSVDFGMM